MVNSCTGSRSETQQTWLLFGSRALVLIGRETDCRRVAGVTATVGKQRHILTAIGFTEAVVKRLLLLRRPPRRGQDGRAVSRLETRHQPNVGVLSAIKEKDVVSVKRDGSPLPLTSCFGRTSWSSEVTNRRARMRVL